jgi:hypothetical protein
VGSVTGALSASAVVVGMGCEATISVVVNGAEDIAFLLEKPESGTAPTFVVVGTAICVDDGA